MLRALLELVLTIFSIIVVRALLNSVMKGFRSGSASYGNQRPDASANRGSASTSAPPSAGSELHKDPVCGTYVAESTPYRRQSAGQIFYFCSDDCREKHTLVAK